MQGGDLSNESPPTVMVHVDLLTTVHPVARQLLQPSTWSGVDERKVDVRKMAALYQRARKMNVTFECFCTDGSSLDSVEEYLDRMGTNPFRYFTTYGSIEDVLAEMTYRNNLLGVVDLSSRGLQYGSKFVAFENLA